ncbi:Trm112 family protein [Dietzia sp.]|uniref:Trm112 family protein n=1 Tax=Dietzia sp. TaxID=1871616 RepID=UPI002FDA27F6
MTSLDPRLLEIIACPVDRGPLSPVSGDRLYNPRLHLVYRIEDGIPVLLADEATEAGQAEQAALDAELRR